MLWFKIVVFAMIVGGLAIFSFLRRAAIVQFFSEVKFEMGKVSWPAQEEVVNSTILVLIVTVALALLCLVVDSAFAAILKVFYGG